MERILLKLVFPATLLISCGTYTYHRVPIGKNVTIDGFFDKEEWKGAKTIKITPNNFLYLIQNTDYLFLGVQNNEQTRRYIDLYVASNSGRITNLHASMQLGERELTEYWNDTIPPWNWGNNQGWTSNKVEILDRTGDIPFLERIKPYQGHEFQISKEKIGQKQFRIRLEIKDFIGEADDIIFPNDSESNSIQNWFTIEVH